MKGILDKLTAIFSEQGSFYRKSLVYALLITCIPIAVISIFLYLYAKQQIENQVIHAHQLELEMSSKRLNEQLGQLELYTHQVSYNSIFAPLEQTVLYENFQYVNELMKTLLTLKSPSPLIDDVYVYLANDSVVISGMEGINALKSTDDRKKFQSLLNQGSNIYWSYGIKNPYTKKIDSLPAALVLKLPGDYSRAPYGALIVQLDRDGLNNEINQLNAQGSGASFILNHEGDWVTTGLKAGASSGLEEELRTELLEHHHSDSTFLFKYQGVLYSISQKQYDRTGWRYVAATPLTYLTKPALESSRVIIMMCLFGLLGAVLLAWIASKRIYKPIQHLASLIRGEMSTRPGSYNEDELRFIEEQWMIVHSENQQASKRLKESLPVLKESFLIQFLLGHFDFLTDKELKDKMFAYGWDMEQKGFFVFLIQLLGLRQQEGRFLQGDEQLVTLLLPILSTNC
ncbi:cache domain-containing protein [Paenibacillus sp. N3.4]|uniref:cache domain-containing protein n=1 Tax=Paenibacillus sp. N3.4 TaxID=2603222 RepID=UPI0011CB8E2F|nr:cache domain-containing protein [Paenibacillus sp. N3.4]TXK75874.1 hypothetical protein FU659_27235 [Paenibacillus sp. N3.4]